MTKGKEGKYFCPECGHQDSSPAPCPRCGEPMATLDSEEADHSPQTYARPLLEKEVNDDNPLEDLEED